MGSHTLGLYSHTPCSLRPFTLRNSVLKMAGRCTKREGYSPPASLFLGRGTPLPTGEDRGVVSVASVEGWEATCRHSSRSARGTLSLWLRHALAARAPPVDPTWWAGKWTVILNLGFSRSQPDQVTLYPPITPLTRSVVIAGMQSSQ